MRQRLAVIVGALWLSVLPGWAQVMTSAPPAVVKLHGREIVTLRETIYGLTPAQRAARVVDRFQRSLKAGDRGEVAQVETPLGALITIDDRAFVLLTPNDVNAAGGESLGGVASNTVVELQQAYATALTDYSARSRLIGAGWSLLDTLLVVVVLIAIGRMMHWLGNWSQTRIPVQYRKEVEKIGQPVLEVVKWALWLAALYLWLRAVLEQFVETRAISQRVGAYFWSLIEPVLQGILKSLPDLVVVVIIFIVTRFVARLVRELFRRIAQKRIRVRWLDADTAGPTQRLAVILVWLSAVVMAYPYLPGSNSEAFKSVGVFVGLLVSLGATGVVGQITSGMLLIYTKTFRPGEFVRINENEGTIVSVGLLSTRLRTTKNEEINIPNSVLIGATTKNYSRLAARDGVLLYTKLTIGYTTPWRQVHELLKRAALKTQGLSAEPPPFVLQTALSDFYVEYQLNARLEQPETRNRELAELHEHIQDEFNEHGVQIMSPHYRADPASPQIVPKDKWFEPPAASNQ